MDYKKMFNQSLPYVVGIIAVYVALRCVFDYDIIDEASKMVSKNEEVVEKMENNVEEPKTSIKEEKVEIETPEINPNDLLPKDDNLGFALSNPKGDGKLEDKNFLKAGYHIGINTIGQSLKNANYQVRSDPSIPKVPVSIFNNSTIAADTTRRPLEIGDSQ